jgi:hypothetical protein
VVHIKPLDSGGLKQVIGFFFLFFTGVTTLYVSQLPPWFYESKCKTLLLAPYPLACLAWMVLPGAYAPASIALWVIRPHKPPLHDNVIVLEEVLCANIS